MDNGKGSKKSVNFADIISESSLSGGTGVASDTFLTKIAPFVLKFQDGTCSSSRQTSSFFYNATRPEAHFESAT